MGKEIERKFLVKNADWKEQSVGTPYLQGYLSTDKKRTVRVRVAGQRGFLTIKGESNGVTRTEFEYVISRLEALQMLKELCEQPIIEKTRYRLFYDGLVWEIDEFHGENAGLIVAEVELSREDQDFLLPSWVGEEVSHDARYFNSNLLKHPYSSWPVAPPAMDPGTESDEQ